MTQGSPAAGQPDAVAQPGGNLISLGTIQVFRLVSGMAVNVMVMRGLGVEGFGVYGYVTTLVGLASFGASMGMDRLLKREIARDERSAGRYVATAVAASTLLSFVTSAFILGWATLMDGRPVVVAACALASLAMAIGSLDVIPVAYFHAIRRMNLGVSGNGAGRLALVLGTAVGLWLSYGVLAVFGAQVLDAAVTFVILWRIYRALKTPPLATTWREVTTLIRTAIPFGFNSLFVSIYLTVDVLLLARWWDDAEVGTYRGAVMLLTMITVVAETYSTGVFPRMARHLGNREEAGRELSFAARILLVISVPVAVGGWLTAEPLLVFVGGEDYAASALPFAIMAPLLPLRFLSNGYGMTLTALDHQEDRTRGALYAAALNVAVNLWAIPAYGAVGAAGTTLLTELMLYLWMQWRVLPLVTGLGLGPTVLRVAVPSVTMAVAIVLLPPLHVVLTIGAGAMVYLAVGVATGAIRRSDPSRLRGV